MTTRSLDFDELRRRLADRYATSGPLPIERRAPRRKPRLPSEQRILIRLVAEKVAADKASDRVVYEEKRGDAFESPCERMDD